MFRGNAPATIDSKGRLKVPNAFRSQLESKYGRELFLTSVSGEYVRIYPMPVWLEIEQKLGEMPSTQPSKLRLKGSFPLALSSWRRRSLQVLSRNSDTISAIAL